MAKIEIKNIFYLHIFTKFLQTKIKGGNMKSTGIVRKVDELGRVVIPKEIRKTSFISEGTPLEIYSGDDGEIILKKYSLVKNLKFFADIVIESLNDFIKGKVAIYDKNEIIASSGISLKNAINFYTENSFNRLHSKSGLISHNGCNILFEPIKSDGIVIGGIMVWDTEFTKDILTSCNIMANYLGKLTA